MGIPTFYVKYVNYRHEKDKVKTEARLMEISAKLSEQSVAIKSLGLRKDALACAIPTFAQDNTTKSIVKVIKDEIRERKDLVSELTIEQVQLNDHLNKLNELAERHDTSAVRTLVYS